MMENPNIYKFPRQKVARNPTSLSFWVKRPQKISSSRLEENFFADMLLPRCWFGYGWKKSISSNEILNLPQLYYRAQVLKHY
jgi:hypothetical protein